MTRLRKTLSAACLVLWTVSVPAVAQTETDPLQAKIDVMSAEIVSLQGELAALQVLVTDLAAAGVQAKFPRHGLVKLNWLPDPYPIECATTMDVPAECDPTSNVYDADEDPVTWDQGVCLNGTLAMVADVPTYTPAAGFTGTDTCTADVMDDAGYALETEITVTVAGP